MSKNCIIKIIIYLTNRFNVKLFKKQQLEILYTRKHRKTKTSNDLRFYYLQHLKYQLD